MKKNRLVPLLGLSLSTCAHLLAADPEVDLSELKRLPAVEASNAVSTFTVKPGFHLELVASEPLIRSPIEICFDENGRMFVVEMVDYSEMRDQKPHWGRISMLEDTNGDGRYDKSTVFVDDLPWPTGVFWANHGVYAAATPDIFFAADKGAPGTPRKKDRVFTGFGIDYAPYRTNQLNMQAMLNSLRWGMDNRIHGVSGPNGGEVTSLVSKDKPSLNVRGRDFVIDERTQNMETEAGGGQYGMAFDTAGRRYTCNNSDHIRVYMYDIRYGARNSFYTMPPALESIAVDGPAAEVYRTSPDEPWRLIRTRWRVSGAVPGMIEGGGRASGYFTSATGIMIYRGDAWGSDYVDDAFIADCGSNLIHRKKVRRDGVSLRAERPAEEQRVEFISSRDTWFRPVQLANAPDGTLYIVDMYREIIEHPWSIPPSLKKHLDLNSGNNRGRIYRVVPDNYQPRKTPHLGNASTAELVQTLAHPNGWHRDTAARLLYERQDRKAVAPLEKLLSQSPSALGRMHALHALDGLGALRIDHLQRAFDDSDALVREHAIKLSEKFIRDSSKQGVSLRQRLMALAADPAPTVRYQLAFTLGEMEDSHRIKALAEIVRRDAGDSWIRAAVLSSLARGSSEMFRETVAMIGTGNSGVEEKAQADLQAFLRELLQVIGARNDSNEVARVLDYVGGANDPALAFALVHGLGEGLQRAHASLPTARIQPVIDRATKIAADKSQAAPARVEAVELLGLTSFSQSGALLFSLLDLNQPQTVQLAAMRTLGRFTDSKIGPEIAGHWTSLTPRLRNEALTVLLARPERIPALLDAVEAGAIRRADLASPQIDFLTNHRDHDLRARAIKLLTAGKTSTRQEVVTAFQPALTLTGDAARGKKIFVERCASCHRLGGEGYVLGPDLVSVRNAGKDKLLISILDPNREVLPQYLAYEIETKDEESLLGILVNETASSVTLRQSYGKDTVVPRLSIARMQSRGQSMMPEGLESNLQPQDIADLLEFVMTAPQ